MAGKLVRLILDSGALIAAEKSDRRFWILWKKAVVQDFELIIPCTVLAQSWRGSKSGSRMAIVVNSCVIESLSAKSARAIGELCGKADTSDVVDAHVVLAAHQRNAAIVTSDPDDISHLASFLNRSLRVLDIASL